MTNKLTELRQSALKLPLNSGVYLMKDKNEKIIYIGKAKALKNRVSQYFGSQKNHNEKVRRMVANVDKFDYIITDSEFEALILECSLIKQHTPKYNILLKDDKGYSYIKITNDEWQKIKDVKQKENDNAIYLGPYNSGYYVKNAVDEARKIFKLPSCNKDFSKRNSNTRPCLNYHIKQCNAPCCGKINHKEYQEIFAEAVDFIKGGSSASINELTKKMIDASEKMEYERAGKIRDRINSVKQMKERQKVVANKVREQDVIALVRDNTKGCFQVLKFRDSKLVDMEHFIVQDVGEPTTARFEFLTQYYSMRDEIPKRVTVDGEVEDVENLQIWLTEKANKKVEIQMPIKGEQMSIVNMCKTNAVERLAQYKGVTGKQMSTLDELSNILGLSKIPIYIESYDISNLAGSENVAGMVVFENGTPLKSAYRKFEIKTIQGQDDYGSMAEVINRRLNEYEKKKAENADDNEGFARLPDLILLDGGKGHVGVIEQVLKSRGYDIPLFGMVKDDKHKTRAITGNGREISITNKRNVFTLVSTIQDEVHRFAIGYHRQKRKANTFKSTLTEINGVGTTRAKALLKHFGTIKNIQIADLKELENAPTMNKIVAKEVYDYYHT